MLVVAGLIVFIAAWSVVGSLAWLLLLLGAALVVGFWLGVAYKAGEQQSERNQIPGLVPRTETRGEILPAPEQPTFSTVFGMRQAALRYAHVLAQQGNAVLASMFVQMNEVYAKAVGRVIEQKKQIHNAQERQLSEAFFETSARELGEGLLGNYRLAEGQVKRVTSASFPLEPEPHPVRNLDVPAGRVVEYRAVDPY